MQDEIATAIGEKDCLLDSMFGSALTSCLDPGAEFAQVQGILRRAQKCRALKDAEPGWNEPVHCRVLELALGEQGSVGFQNIYDPLPLLTLHASSKIFRVRYLPRYLVASLMDKQHDGKDLSRGVHA